MLGVANIVLARLATVPPRRLLKKIWNEIIRSDLRKRKFSKHLAN